MTIDLELPEDKFISTFLTVGDVEKTARNCSYSVTGIEQLVREATCLIKILHTFSVSQMKPGRQIISSNQHIPWLVDSLEEINEERKRWRHHCQHSPCIFLELTLQLADSSSTLNDLVTQKLYTIIVLISADVAGHPEEFISTAQDMKSATKTLALSLAHLSSAVIKKRPIAKLVSAKLLKSLESYSVERDDVEDTGDLSVCHPHIHPLLPF